MQAIILCAGYATRLYPITVNFPKPLLTVARKEISTHLIEALEATGKVDKINIITNSKFYPHFKIWAGSCNQCVNIIDDKTNSEEKRLGAIGDLRFAIESANIDDDIIVLAGDNLVSFNLMKFIKFFEEKQAPIMAAYDIEDKKLIAKKKGCVLMNDKNKIIDFEEKPKEPKSTLACPPFYIYPKSSLKLIKEYLDQGNNPDAPGSFVEWLHKKQDIFVFEIQNQYEIGSVESYNQVNNIFSKKSKKYCPS